MASIIGLNNTEFGDLPHSFILAAFGPADLLDTRSECIPQNGQPRPRSRRIEAGEEPGAPSSDVCFSLLFLIEPKALK